MFFIYFILVPPEVQLYSNRISQYKGRETILDCQITANPHGFMVWKRAGKAITNSWKYDLNIYEDDMYTKILSLRIGNIDKDDYGKYKCFASNFFGRDDEDMLLYGECSAVFIEPPRGKTINVVSDQVRHKPTCTVTEKS